MEAWPEPLLPSTPPPGLIGSAQNKWDATVETRLRDYIRERVLSLYVNRYRIDPKILKNRCDERYSVSTTHKGEEKYASIL